MIVVVVVVVVVGVVVVVVVRVRLLGPAVATRRRLDPAQGTARSHQTRGYPHDCPRCVCMDTHTHR